MRDDVTITEITFFAFDDLFFFSSAACTRVSEDSVQHEPWRRCGDDLEISILTAPDNSCTVSTTTVRAFEARHPGCTGDPISHTSPLPCFPIFARLPGLGFSNSFSIALESKTR